MKTVTFPDATVTLEAVIVGVGVKVPGGENVMALAPGLSAELWFCAPGPRRMVTVSPLTPMRVAASILGSEAALG